MASLSVYGLQTSFSFCLATLQIAHCLLTFLLRLLYSWWLSLLEVKTSGLNGSYDLTCLWVHSYIAQLQYNLDY